MKEEENKWLVKIMKQKCAKNQKENGQRRKRDTAQREDG